MLKDKDLGCEYHYSGLVGRCNKLYIKLLIDSRPNYTDSM